MAPPLAFEAWELRTVVRLACRAEPELLTVDWLSVIEGLLVSTVRRALQRKELVVASVRRLWEVVGLAVGTVRSPFEMAERAPATRRSVCALATRARVTLEWD